MILTFAPWIWLAVIVLFVVMEVATCGLISIWFAAGAVAALIVSLFTNSLAVQIIVFLVVSFAALALTRPFIKRHKMDRVVPTNADMNVGRKGVVIADITPDLPGRVKLDGVDWAARSEQTLATGSLCVVLTLEGATLTVRADEGAKLV